MTLTFANNTPIEIAMPTTDDFSAPPSFLLQVDGGTLAVERKRLSGAWQAIDGSPFSSGAMKILTVRSHSPNLRYTAESSAVEADIERL